MNNIAYEKMILDRLDTLLTSILYATINPKNEDKSIDKKWKSL
jgi:hypothetical protein